MLAAAAAALGFAYDAGSGNNELSVVFSICYVGGCVLAVLAVRQSGVFTAVIQPPLILFVIVPAAYFVFHGSSITGIKDILINCGYPLIERFPLMFFTSAAVLVIGLVRWYIALSARRAAPKDGEPEAADGAASQAAETTTGDAGKRPRAAGAASTRSTAPPAPPRPRKHRASPGRHPGPPRRRGHPAHAMRVPRRPRSPSRARTVPGDDRLRRSHRLPNRPPTAASGPAPGRPANRAATRPRSTPAARTNGPSARSDPVLPNVRNVVAGQRHPSRTSPTTRSSPARRTVQVGRIIRCRGCATAGPTTVSQIPSTALDRGAHPLRTPIRGSTTSDGYVGVALRAGRISRGSANTNVSLAVVTGCTMS